MKIILCGITHTEEKPRSEVFEEKDLKISRLSCIKTAAELINGTNHQGDTWEKSEHYGIIMVLRKWV